NGVDLLQPFMVTAVPGEPDNMLSLASGTSGSILQYSGSVGVLLQDQYGNPVANAPVKFATGSPTPYRGFCSSTDANQEKLIAQLTTDWGCMDQLPAWGECAESNDVVSLSASNGIAAAGVVLGSMPDGSYPVSAGYVGPALSSPLTDRQFVSHSSAMLNGYCGGETPPLNYFTIQKEDYRVRPANSAVKVRVKTQMFAEGESITTGQESLTCGEDQYQCPQLQGDKSFDSSEPSSLSVLIDGQETSLIPDVSGMYEAEVNIDLGSNSLTVQAEALKTINALENDCANAGVCAAQPTQIEKIFSADWSVDYTGVAVQLGGPIHIPMDENGYATSSTQISFDILPNGYEAVSSAFVLYEDDNPVYAYETAKSGSPVAQIPMGFWFDENATYTVKVILNNGWEDAQIDSAFAEIKHGGFDLDVDSDNTNFMLVNGAYKDPELDSLEEQVEDLLGGAGKVIRINSGDFDGDNIKDFVEMIDANTMEAANALHPMILSVSSASYMSQAKIRFKFLESGLTNVQSTGQVNPGYLRIWTKDGTVNRSIASVATGGDYVPAGAWLTPAQLTNTIDS
ncbi:MAG: hypothetical protein KAU27_14910, partial [Desulfuromonadales bacterium]|nr:hypothetical protein [Desulfuromonadales bacterium]